MAAIGRNGETTTVNNNIYDNNAKEVDPEKVRAALAVIIESNFNLVDDLLKDMDYDTGQTLQQKLDNASTINFQTVNISSWSLGSQFNVTHNAGSIPLVVQVLAVCTSAEHGYSSGDIVAINPSAATNSGLSVQFTSTNSATVYVSDSVRVVQGQANYGRVGITASRWDLRFNFIFQG